MHRGDAARFKDGCGGLIFDADTDPLVEAHNFSVFVVFRAPPGGSGPNVRRWIPVPDDYNPTGV